MKKVESSNIEAVGYDPNTKELTVKFKNGGTYHYSAVPSHEADALMHAESIGKHFHAHIKGKFQHQKVSHSTSPDSPFPKTSKAIEPGKDSKS